VALAFNGSANANQSPFIRSFGTSDTSGAAVLADLSWHIADGDGRYHAGGIGQWGLRMSRLLMDTYQIPIAVLNGAHIGKGISWFQRNEAEPGAVNTNYGRLLFRAQTAEVINAVRAIFWFQGESDGAAAAVHENGFLALYNDWKSDYPHLEKIYVNQVRTGCGNPGIDLRDRQRRLADTHDDIAVMSTTGLDGHDGCHFAFTNGYEELGAWLFRLVGRDLYGAASTPNIAPPNIERAYFSNASKSEITLVMRDPDDTLIWEAGAENDFRLEGSSVSVTSGAISGNHLVLALSGNGAAATGISYLGHPGAGSWVTNGNGIGLLAFYNVPILASPASAPGGVAEGLKLWLKADAGVEHEAGKVNAWADQSSFGYTFAAVGAGALRPDFSAAFLNNNSVISINETQHGLAAPSHLDHPASDYTFVAVFQQTGGEYFVDNLNAVRFKLNNGPLGLYRQNDYHLTGFNTTGYALQTWRFEDGHNPAAEVFRHGAAIASDNAYVSMPLTNNLRIGSRFSLEDPSNFAGNVAEFIIYSRPLASAERQRVESYLAIKYGFTLEQSTAQNYVAADGTVIYPAAATHDNFDHDIAGIGRDDSQALNQTQSRSFNPDDVVTIGLASNLNDGEYFLWGNNGAMMTAVTEVPAGYVQRLARIWRVAETGEVGAVTVSFDLTGMTAIDLNNNAGFALLVNDDGNFANANALTNAALTGAVASFANVNLNHGQYFSLAYPASGLTKKPAPSGMNVDLPNAFQLSPNFPNPFNLQTTIAYALPQAAHVRLSIFNATGQLVRRLVEAFQTPGNKTIKWDGKDNNGFDAGSGIYLFKMEAGSYQQTRKMILQK